MVTDSLYSLIHTAAVAVALGAAVVFLGTSTSLRRLWPLSQFRQFRQLRQLSRYRRPLRLASGAAVASALCVQLFVTSPLEYRASAPAPAGLKLYVLSASNELFTLQAADGAQTFVRHLPGSQLQIVYHDGGLMILEGPGQNVLAATATTGTTGTAGPTGPAGTAGSAAGASAATSGQVWAFTHTLHAVRGDDGQAVLPALGALTHVTADTLDHGTLYVSAIADPAHPDVETLSAFSLLPGALRWQRMLTTPAPPPALMPPQFCESESESESGALYMVLGTSIVAVRTSDGAVLWRSAPLWSTSARPRISALRCVAQEEGVYLELGGGSLDDPRVLIKLNERDGTQRWTVPVAALVSVAGDRLYATRATRGPVGPTGLLVPNLVVLRASDGAEVGAPLEMRIDALQAPYSVTSAGVLYVVGRSTSPADHTPGPCEVFALRLRDGVRLWQRPPHACDALDALRVAGAMLYYGTNDGDLTAFGASDGTVRWTHTGYHRGGEFFHWADTFAIAGFSSGVLFVYATHDGPCRFLVVGCDPDNGEYLEALNPATGTRYWRYHSDHIADYFLSAAP